MDYQASDPLGKMRARSGSVVGGTVGGYLHSVAAQYPDRAFVKVDRSEWLSYGALDDVSDRIAGGLARLGCEKGDRVVVILPNRQEAVELLFACAKAGAVQVPINIWLKGEFLRYQLAFSGAKILIADADGYRAAAPLLSSTDVETVVLVGDEIDTDEARGFRTVRYEDLGAVGAAWRSGVQCVSVVSHGRPPSGHHGATGPGCVRLCRP
jgi:acyl-CoA synthetase (AMP-forming)/AMP-acid ligase II